MPGSNSSDRLRSELRRSWAVLGRGGEDAEAVVTYPVARTPAGWMQIHVSSSGHRHLLVPGEYAGPGADGVSLALSTRRLVLDGREEGFLDIECRQPALFDVFDELVVMVIDAAGKASNPTEAAANVVADWRDLLRKGPIQPLSFQRELGLFAELLVLEELTAAGRFDPEWWKGPLHEPKDVVTPDVWIEVKGVGEMVDRTDVHGLGQLADVEGLAGYLAVVTVQADDDGAAVQDLVASLAARTDEPDLLDERLRVAGWSGTTPTDRRWTASDLLLVRVGDCPRLVPDTLVAEPPRGVSQIRYALDLAVLRIASVRDPWGTIRSLTGRA